MWCGSVIRSWVRKDVWEEKKKRKKSSRQTRDGWVCQALGEISVNW